MTEPIKDEVDRRLKMLLILHKHSSLKQIEKQKAFARRGIAEKIRKEKKKLEVKEDSNTFIELQKEGEPNN